MRISCAAAIAALFLFLSGGIASAQDVTLRSRDGAIALTGTLLGFDGDFYRIESRYGEITVDGTGVTCEGPGCPSLTEYVADITISGSAAIGKVLMPALVEGFALRNGLSFERISTNDTQFRYELTRRSDDKLAAIFRFRVSSTDEGFADLLADEADLVMATREIQPTELQLAAEAGLGQLDDQNRSRVLALDALVPVVAPGNPLNAITLNDLARVFAGQIDNWRMLGGPDAGLALHLRDRESGIAQDVERRIIAPISASLSPGVLRHRSDAELEEAVTRDPLSIGLTRLSELGNAKPLRLSGSCGFALREDRISIKTEDYPLTAQLFLYIPARRLPALTRDFLAFTRSPPAQVVIRRAGFVDQAAEEVPVNQQGDRLANAIRQSTGKEDLDELKRLVDTLAPLKRLTITFRFEPGATRLDAQSRANILRLASAIEDGTYDGRTLLFVGFSDGDGAADANLKISTERAHAIKRAVEAAVDPLDLSQVTLGTDAFGEILPMACDDTTWGRTVNRRVEVWVR